MSQQQAGDGHSENRVLNHVGLSVPDLDAALVWYQQVLGFRLLTPPVEMRAEDPGLGSALEAMLGSGVRRFRMAHLSMGNGVGLQVFQFLDPGARRYADADAPWKGGFTHICLTASDIEGLAREIERRGGTSSAVFRAIPGRPYAAAYCRDPWGNVVELNSHGYVETRTFLGAEVGEPT
jgi:catechol 2,3-dioxygenase-like lactoylglutathione lyase family enzyme